MDESPLREPTVRGKLPQHEIDLLEFAIAKAEQSAGEHGVVAGFQALRRGVARAQREQAAGVPYGADLVLEWCSVADSFAARFGAVLLNSTSR